MKIQLRVIDHAGTPPAEPLGAILDDTGGTIGRAPGNKLVLPDPQRTVSRVHAQVVKRQAATVVISRGTNGLEIDGQHLEIGEETPLRDGSTLALGGYRVEVRLAA